jgi:hypothetical protein
MSISDFIARAKAGAGTVDDDDGADVPEITVPDDLSGFDDIPADPPPNRRAQSKSAPSRPAGVTAAVRRQVKDSLLIVFEIQGGMMLLRDPVCGNAILQNAETVATRLVPIICRNPGVLAWFTATGAPFMDWLMLIKAVQPIASTVWAHHVTHTIPDPLDDAPGDDWSAYAAPVYR